MVADAEALFLEVPQLKEALVSPVVKKSEKNRVIDRVFPAELRNFLKVLCGHQDMDLIEDVFEAYHAYACEQEGSLRATLYYVTEPDAEQRLPCSRKRWRRTVSPFPLRYQKE